MSRAPDASRKLLTITAPFLNSCSVGIDHLCCFLKGALCPGEWVVSRCSKTFRRFLQGSGAQGPEDGDWDQVNGRLKAGMRIKRPLRLTH